MVVDAGAVVFSTTGVEADVFGVVVFGVVAFGVVVAVRVAGVVAGALTAAGSAVGDVGATVSTVIVVTAASTTVLVGSGAAAEVDAVAGVVFGVAPRPEPLAQATRRAAEQVTAMRSFMSPIYAKGCANQRRRSWTSVTLWSAPLRSTNEARERVGAMFSRRLRPLISRQMNCAVAVASS